MGQGAKSSVFQMTVLIVLLVGVVVPAWSAESSQAAAAIEEITVVGTRSVLDLQGVSGSGSVVTAEALERTGALHVNEVASRVPGVWISRGSGQEHLTAIRSGVLTGAGACGAFAYLEDGLAIRPSGFCNINNLFELNTEQAQRIEFLRGPASAILGGNALRGAVNVVSQVPEETRLRVEGGSNDFYRVSATGALDLGGQRLGVALHSAHSGGYRDDTGYGQQKLNLTHRMAVGDWSVLNTVSATLLNQETGGFVVGEDAFEERNLRRTNPNPEAFRDAWALRVASHWQRDALTITPYFRRSRMAFLQHFLPGQPLEENEQSSAGVLTRYQFATDRLSGTLGLQVEIMRSALREDQDGPTISDSAFLVETRPAGLHYDYEVDSTMVAGFYNLTYAVSDHWRLEHSLRAERLAYDYDNLFLVGNTREDGTVCGFGGCRYTRPASRDDTFSDLAGRIGLVRSLGEAELYLTVGSGFRAPQATELYRLQDGQLVTDLDSEEILAIEAGIKLPSLSLAVFRQRSRNLIFRDSEGFNLANGRSKGFGVELEWRMEFERQYFDIAATWAKHQYDFNSTISLGEVIRSGNDLDTAPRWLGSARWGADIGPRLNVEAEVVHVGEHYTDAANTAEYDGHWLVNWRGSYQVSDSVKLFARVHNLFNERYAERADFAFGNDRFFPGISRQFYVGVDWRR